MIEPKQARALCVLWCMAKGVREKQGSGLAYTQPELIEAIGNRWRYVNGHEIGAYCVDHPPQLYSMLRLLETKGYYANADKKRFWTYKPTEWGMKKAETLGDNALLWVWG